jgi:hypothetical protein
MFWARAAPDYTRISQSESAREPIMNLQLSNADLVLIIALALGIALVLALRLRTATWRAVVAEAIAANVAAIAAVLAIEMLLA